MLKYYTLITGDDISYLKGETPDSIRKIKLYGMIIQLPVMLWLFESYLLVTKILKGDPVWAVFTAVIFAFVVFIIERSIIMSDGRMFIFITRIILGVLVATVGAVVMDEVIFSDDINFQLEQNFRTHVSSEALRWQQENIAPVEDCSKNVNLLDSLQRNALDIYLGEINGTYGTGIKGVSKVANAKWFVYQNALNVFNEEKMKLDSMKSDLEKRKQAFIENLNSRSPDGFLLLRIKAMWDLVSNDRVIMISWFVFTFIFLLIDILVVLVKMYSKKTNFEKMNELREEVGEDKIRKIKKRHEQNYNPDEKHPAVRSARTQLKSISTGILNQN